jgi:TIR domain
VSPGAASAPAPRVFICYRREDTAAHAGRLYDAMVNRFGERNVFMDVDLAPGVDFVERITEVVSACQVLIVVMGPHWATVEDEDGDVRIADPEDFVRLEVETALRRPDVTPIPVLVSEARMPKREALPPELQPLTRRNALEMSNSRWGYDVDRLNDTLDELLTDLTRSRENVAPRVAAPEAGPTPAAEPPTPTPGPPTPTPVPATPAPRTHAPPDPVLTEPAPLGTRLVLEGMIVGGVTACAARLLAFEIPKLGAGVKGHIAGDVILRHTETWALVGAALAIWLASRTRRTDLSQLGMLGLLVGAVAGAVGAATWALPVLTPHPTLKATDPALTEWIAVVSLAVTGGFIGALIGSLWSPARLGRGLVAGAVAGVLTQLFVNLIGWGDPKPGSVTDAQTVLAFGLAGFAFAGLTLARLVALGAGRAGASVSAPARGR